MEAATLCDGGCNPMWRRLQPHWRKASCGWTARGRVGASAYPTPYTLHHPEQVYSARLQPHVLEAAAPCDGGCNPMWRWRTKPRLAKPKPYPKPTPRAGIRGGGGVARCAGAAARGGP
eukprot:scaffold22408_cov52-Phaeocystis_antarctica.AAC.2